MKSKLQEFWPIYLSQHQVPLNRLMHVIGTIFSLLGTAVLLFLESKLSILALSGLVAAYLLSWCGHFLFESNLPLSWKHPLLSLLCDVRMTFHVLQRRSLMFEKRKIL